MDNVTTKNVMALLQQLESSNKATIDAIRSILHTSNRAYNSQGPAQPQQGFVDPSQTQYTTPEEDQLIGHMTGLEHAEQQMRQNQVPGVPMPNVPIHPGGQPPMVDQDVAAQLGIGQPVGTSPEQQVLGQMGQVAPQPTVHPDMQAQDPNFGMAPDNFADYQHQAPPNLSGKYSTPIADNSPLARQMGMTRG